MEKNDLKYSFKESCPLEHAIKNNLPYSIKFSNQYILKFDSKKIKETIDVNKDNTIKDFKSLLQFMDEHLIGRII